MNYDNKRFSPAQNTDNGETTPDTIFEYRQTGNILTSEYKDGQIVQGHLIGLVDEDGHIDMRYHEINGKGELMTGVCHSISEVKVKGKIRLHEE